MWFLYSEKKKSRLIFGMKQFIGGMITQSKIRFVESGDKYWFVMGGDSSKPQTNKSFFKEF